MGRTGLTLCAFALGVLSALLPAGCKHNHKPGASTGAPIVRVRLHQNQDQVLLTATAPPIVESASGAHRLKVPEGSSVEIKLAPAGWEAGGVHLGAGEQLHIRPDHDGSLRVNGNAYRGTYRIVATSPGRFDVINEVEIDDYLKGVVAREVLAGWDMEAYKAQAVAARTYALYEVSSAGSRYWHVHDDTRSQVYGGIAAETTKSVNAVDETAGVVLAYGPRGRERIFKAYFSSCCGGIGQSASDALGEPDIPPLMERNVGSTCNASPRFNWPAVVIEKSDLSRRVRAWGVRRGRPEKNIATITSLQIAQTNRYGRPTRFVFIDSRAAKFSLNSEETRWAINTEPNGGPTVLSSFFQPFDEGDSIRLVDGHGWGHGVGMCQWCAQTWATRGVRHEDILRASYPGAVLVRAY